MIIANPKVTAGQPSETSRILPTFAKHRSINDLICLLAVLAIGFTGILGHDLWTPDEHRVAAIVLEMAQTGNFVIPHLAGVPFIEKPPLYFAVAAIMLKVMGPLIGPVGAIRLTSALFGLGVLLMTFLITRRLWGNKTGVLAVAVLATMEGFVENFHWIVVDPALAFFVVAFVWCLVEIYFNNRRFWFPLAGFFLAGAFLSKGAIGPALAFIPWLGLMVIWFFEKREQRDLSKGFVTAHLWLLLVFVIMTGLWIVLLYIKGGPRLWNEWFWVNQVGRFTGQAAKGHIKPGQPLYYVLQAIGYGLPWTPLFLYWLGTTVIGSAKKKFSNDEGKNLFLWIWGIGSIVLLTIPATKRGLYMLPVLPAFAIMVAVSLIEQKTASWFKWYAGFWTTICLVIMAAVLIIPLTPGFLPNSIPEEVKAVLVDFNHYHVIILIWLAICMVAIIRFRDIISKEYMMVLTTTGLLVVLLGVPIQAIDQKESMGADVRRFVSRVPESQRDRIAGFGYTSARQFSETMLGAFYFYTGWKVPQIGDEQRIQQILAGQDKDYDSLLVNRRDKHGDLQPETDLADVPYEILSEMVTGDEQNRKVFWIRGAGSRHIQKGPVINRKEN